MVRRWWGGCTHAICVADFGWWEEGDSVWVDASKEMNGCFVCVLMLCSGLCGGM